MMGENTMGAQATSTDLEQLTQSLAHLTEALASSERRYVQLARIVRWGTLVVFLIVVIVGLTVSNTVGIAHAEKEQGFQQGQTVVEALNNINANLTLFGMAGDGLQQVVPAIQDTMMKNPDVQSQVKAYLKEQGIEETPENMKRYATAAILKNTVSTLVDAVVLMQRIREDSNAFREMVGGPGPALHAIQHELRLMNGAMMSIPAMATQMDLMNRNMATMSYSMGSTMGRMGNWMPW
jgi:hypothetical protein